MMMSWKRKWNKVSSGAAVDSISAGVALDNASAGAAVGNLSAGTTVDNDNSASSGAADVIIIIYHQDQGINLYI